MKTLKLTLAAFALLFVSVASYATAKDKVSKEDVVNMYINAIANGKTSGFDKVLDKEMRFNMMRGDKVNTMDKEHLLNYLTQNPGAVAPLNTSSTILQSDDNSEKVQIDFKYDGYVRTDVVTIDYSLGWKVVDVTSSYK